MTRKARLGKQRPEPPLTPGTTIWRYFDFSKFVSLLDSKSLFFPSASNLEDPFEGALPFYDVACSGRDLGGGEKERHLARDLTLISSWHINSDESFAMWRLYAKSLEAVAVRSTVGKLSRCFRPKLGAHLVVKRVSYIDYERDRILDLDSRSGSNHLAPFLCKAKPYSYENEVRAVIDLYGRFHLHPDRNDPPVESNPFLKRIFYDRGAYLPVSLETLIEGIYIAPSAGKWFFDLMQGVLRKYRIKLKPRQSVLALRPVY